MGIRERSGEVNSSNPLVGFLYILMRDHLVSGEVEEIMRKISYGEEMQFSNGWLAKHALDIAERLKNGSEKTQEDDTEEL